MQIGSIKWKNLIKEGAEILDIQMDQEHLDKFAVHATELMKWTAKTNLTTITDPLEVAVKHYLDSLAPAPMIQPDSSLLDIGSGGGFPGIPLKILIPSLSVTLIDASRKKVSFLMHMIRILGLDNIVARHIRAEDLAEERHPANTYDVIMSRALSSLDDMVLLARPLLAGGGTIMALKSKVTGNEITSMHSEAKKKPDISKTVTLTSKSYTLPFLKLERYVIIIKPLHEPIETQSPSKERGAI